MATIASAWIRSFWNKYHFRASSSSVVYSTGAAVKHVLLVNVLQLSMYMVDFHLNMVFVVVVSPKRLTSFITKKKLTVPEAL